MTHASLLARLTADADPMVWGEFLDRYGELIQSFARRQNLQAADRDDVVQDVLVALTQNMPRFTYDQSRGKFRSYLKTITLRAIFKKSLLSRICGRVPVRVAAQEHDRWRFRPLSTPDSRRLF